MTTRELSLAKLSGMLRDSNGLVRQKARRRLIARGEESAEVFLKCLSEDPQARLEGVKGLFALSDPKTVDQLVELLHDENHALRWIAGEALIRIGKPSLIPILRGLEAHPTHDNFFEGAHHVLHELALAAYWFGVLGELHKAMEGDYAARLEVPRLALKALEQLGA